MHDSIRFASGSVRFFTYAALLAGLALIAPGCDCAGNNGMQALDAGDTGPAPGDGGDGGRDAGHDANVDANADANLSMLDAGMDACVSTTETCNNLDDDCNGLIDDNVTQSCGSGVGACRMGIQTCAAGAFGTCTGGVGPVAEICGNGIDDDCNEMTDDGCTCSTGAMQSCGSGVGECRRGTQTCTASAWGTCVGEVVPVMEACDGVLDEDCDGTVDEGCTCTSGSMQACGSAIGACMPGMQMCVAGAWSVCTGGTQPMMETCNGADDNCDGNTDEGNPGGGASCGSSMGICVMGVETCTAGAIVCMGGVMPGVETCNGMDDDCDGSTDEGNPGGGVVCPGETDVGGCVSRTACVAGALICRGTFVAPPGAGGSPTNDGSPTSPLSTIALAQANATTIGGGADVCVCDPIGGAASTYPENVVMIEGTSVLGNYDCASWTRTGGAATGIIDVDADGVNFPAGITSVTSLEQMAVLGLSLSAGGGTQSQAITISGSSPQILNVTTVGGAAPTSIAIECVGCGAQLTNVTAAAGAGTNLGLGFHGTGALTGLSVMASSFSGGNTSGATSASSGVRLEGCTSASTWTMTNSFGGGSPAGGAPVGTRTGFEVTGATCAPSVTGGTHTGCEVGGATCIGVSCTMGAQCSFTGSLGSATGAGIRGSQGHVVSCIGVQCLSGGCASFVNNSISAGSLLAASTVGMGMQIDGASPAVDRNTITGPSGALSTPAMMGRFYGLYLHSTRALVTNNIILDGTWIGAIDVVHFDASVIGPARIEPTVHSNTIQYTACAACAGRVGLGLAGVVGAGQQGIFRNNIFDHSGAGGVSRAVVEYDANADPTTFENNDMNDTVIYFDEGTTPLAIAGVNALAGSMGNIAGTCGLTVTQHLPGTGSACYDAGSSAGTPPDHDFDAQSRPFSVLGGGRYDIGADEFHP